MRTWDEWTLVGEATSGDFRLEVRLDEDASHDDPRQWDNVGTMLTWTRNYESPDSNGFDTPDDFTDWWVAEGHAADESATLLPVYMLDHSGVSYSTSDYNDRWDSGQVGWIYATAEQAESFFVVDVAEALRAEVETYSRWAAGDVYLWVLVRDVTCECCKNVEERIIEACGGYVGEIDVRDIFFPDEIPNEDQAALLAGIVESAPYVVKGES